MKSYLADYPAEDGIWPSSRGESDIRDMDRAHLISPMNLCIRRKEETNDELHQIFSPWIKAFQAEIDKRDQEEEKSMGSEIDDVTLVQVAMGVKVYHCTASYKDRAFHFKSNDVYVEGDQALAMRKDGAFYVVNVKRDVTSEFEPEPGITYSWLLKRLDKSLGEPNFNDKEARHKMRIGDAAKRARQALDLAGVTPAMLGFSEEDEIIDQS